MTEPQVKTCLEVTGNIVIAAIQSGQLSGDADAVAEYFGTLYRQVFTSSLTQPADV